MSIATLSLQNVQPKAGGPMVAEQQQPSSPSDAPPMHGGPASLFAGLWPLLVFIPIIYMMFRRQKKETEARSKLKKGDKVVTNGGLIGELVELEGGIAKVRVAPGTTVQVLAPTISPFGGDAEKAAAASK